MTHQKPNRKARRAKISRTKLAKLAARDSFDCDALGRIVKITNDLAVSVLTRAYYRLFKSGAHCHAERLTYEEAKAFPANRLLAEGNHSVLAVGYDVGGNCSFSIRNVKQDWLEETEQWHIATLAAIQDVYDMSKSDGLPIGPVAGRC